MLTRTYLDALSPGMRARLDPLSRIVKGVGTARLFFVMRNGPSDAPSKNRPGPAERYKRRPELRTRVAAY